MPNEPAAKMSPAEAARILPATQPRSVIEPIRTGIALTMFAAAILFYWHSVLAIDFFKTRLLDLGPYPDAVEYFAVSHSLLASGRPLLQIGHDWLPSRYPPGFSTVIAAVMALLPHDRQILAPFRTNQAIGLLLLGGGFLFFYLQQRKIAAGLIALLLATLPAFAELSRSSMSENCGVAPIVFAYMLVYLGFQRQRRGYIYAAAALLGLALNVRTGDIFFAPLMLAMALLPHAGSRWKWLFHNVACLIVFGLCASPTYILNALNFHNPFTTGYQFWVPSLYNKPGQVYSTHFIPVQLRLLWSGIALLPQKYCVADIFGTGTYFVPTFILLALIGLFWLRPSGFLICAGLGFVCYFAGMLTYYFEDIRMYYPVLILLIPVAVLPVEAGIEGLLAGRPRVAMLIPLALYGTTCLGYPSITGHRYNRYRYQAVDIVAARSILHKPVAYLAAESFLERCGGDHGVVLSTIDPAYLNALLPPSLIAAPMDGMHDFRLSNQWRYGTAQATALLQEAVSKSEAAYILERPDDDPAKTALRVPMLAGYRWAPVTPAQPDATILKLEPAAQP